MNKKLIIGIVIIILLGFWGIGSYNSFVSQSEKITAQWAQVENQYQRRFDLIPNLVNTVKGASKQVTDIYEKIAQARASYSGAKTSDARAQAATQLELGLGRLIAIAESNPAITSLPAYQDLMTALEGTENRLSVERMKYNDLVRVYDTKVKSFPSSLLAKMFGFSEHSYFEVPKENQTNPQVNF